MAKSYAPVKNGPKSPVLNKTTRMVLILLVLAVVVFLLANFDLAEVQAFMEQNPRLNFILSLSLIFMTGLGFIPTIPVTVILAVLMGPFPAAIVTSLGNTLSALVHYQIGKQIGDILNFEGRKTRLPFKLGELPVASPLFLLVGRALPGGPKGLSFVCGAYNVPLFSYIWTTLLTNSFGAAFVAYGGDILIKL